MLEAMESSFVSILGVPISRLGMESSATACEQRVRQGQGGYVCFTNVHTTTESTYHDELKSSLAHAFLNLADGMPLVWASKLKKKPIESRVCGPDFAAAWFKAHPQATYGLIGGAPGRAEELAQHFGIRAICYSPPHRPFSKENAHEDWKTFLNLCPSGVPPQVIWIGLGAPKQELWMESVSPLAPSTLFFGIGAAFDFLSGAKSRAPFWMQRSGLEWLYRLVHEPRRLAKRYFVTNTLFLVRLTWELISGR